MVENVWNEWENRLYEAVEKLAYFFLYSRTRIKGERACSPFSFDCELWKGRSWCVIENQENQENSHSVIVKAYNNKWGWT